MSELFQSGSDPYAFVEFADHVAASAALTALNQRLFLGKVSTCALSLFSAKNSDFNHLLIILVRFVFAACYCNRLLTIYNY